MQTIKPAPPTKATDSDFQVIGPFPFPPSFGDAEPVLLFGAVEPPVVLNRIGAFVASVLRERRLENRENILDDMIVVQYS